MADTPVSLPPTALLTATTDFDDERAAGARLSFGDDSVLALQMRNLVDLGVKKILIQVSHVSGELVALSDAFRNRGCEVHLTRTAQSTEFLANIAGPLFVLAEDVFVSRSFLADLLAIEGSYLLTVDAREEHARFELMDLNTRWAGVAMLDEATVASLPELPENWSIASSLLRVGMQRRIPQKGCEQWQLDGGRLRVIANEAEKDQLMLDLAAERAARLPGMFERIVVGKTALWIAEKTRPTGSSAPYLDAAMLVAGTGSLALAGFDQVNLSLLLALLAVCVACSRFTIFEDDSRARLARALLYGLLAAAILVSGYQNEHRDMGAYAAIVLIGLWALAYQSERRAWAASILKSPALLILVLLLSAPILGIGAALQWVSLGQLVILLSAWRPALAKGN